MSAENMRPPGAADKRQRPAVADLDDTTKFFHVGAVAGAHALKGEMRVFPTTDDPERFTEGLVLYARKANAKASERKKDGGGADALRTLTVESARVHGKFVLVKCKEVGSVDEAEALKGTELYVSREDAIPLEEGEYFVVDLIGLSMRDEEGKELGTLKDVISAPANDVYVMEHKETGKEILLPAIKQCILNVDMEQRVMTVHLLDGLLDVY